MTKKYENLNPSCPYCGKEELYGHVTAEYGRVPLFADGYDTFVDGELEDYAVIEIHCTGCDRIVPLAHYYGCVDLDGPCEHSLIKPKDLVLVDLNALYGHICESMRLALEGAGAYSGHIDQAFQTFADAWTNNIDRFVEEPLCDAHVLLTRLIEWEQYMGGFEGELWDEVYRLVGKARPQEENNEGTI
jgi:hypothetical protein